MNTPSPLSEALRGLRDELQAAGITPPIPDPSFSPFDLPGARGFSADWPAFQDAEGTIPASDGDPIALIRSPNGRNELRASPGHEPILRAK